VVFTEALQASPFCCLGSGEAVVVLEEGGAVLRDLNGESTKMARSDGNVIPSPGDDIEMLRTGVSRRGRVWYADQLQILVKWDDGKSSSLRIGEGQFRIIESDHAGPRVDQTSDITAAA
jgi:hypothetical protein